MRHSFARHATRALWLAVAGAGLHGCSEPSAPPVLTVAAITATNGQSARPGTTLPLPLRVRVRLGDAPKAGVTVTWQASAGTILPSSSLTDATGLASATWTLGTEPGTMTVSTSVAGAEGSPVAFSARAVAPALTATAVGTSDAQSGVVGTALPLPLRVQVRSDGAPKEGVTVHWSSLAGRLAPTESTTDSDGYAATRWTLDTVAGVYLAAVKLGGAQVSSVSFVARALAGPAVAIDTAGGSGQTRPVNHGAFDPVIASVTDRYGNAVPGQTVTWTVESGPVAFLSSDEATDAQGRSASVLTPSGTTGAAVVRAALPAGGASTDFALTIAPPTFEVVLSTPGLLTDGPFKFVSMQNGSRSPAVDTIPAGRTLIWTLQFDYNAHGVAAVGTPTFQGGDFPYYAYPSTVSVTFTTPGTYHYADPYFPSVTGIVVVR
jgi:hypothetical protein